MIQKLCETVWQFLVKTDIILPYNLAMSLLDIYTNDLKIYVWKIHTQTFMEALFQKFKMTKMSSVNEWISKLCNIQANRNIIQ
jgi:hypothetical protein